MTKMKKILAAALAVVKGPDGIHWDGVQYADTDAAGEIKGAAFLFKPSPEAGGTTHICLQGLDPDAEYRLGFEDRPEQNRTVTGKELSEKGIDVQIAESVGSEIIWIMQ